MIIDYNIYFTLSPHAHCARDSAHFVANPIIQDYILLIVIHPKLIRRTICMSTYFNFNTVDPPIPPLSGLAKILQYWKTAVKGVIYNQEKTY